MTSESVVRDVINQLRNSPNYAGLWSKSLADKLEETLSQPRPVAQGEAVETDQSIQADCYEMIAEKYEAVGMSPASIVETSEYLADAWSAFQDLPDDTIDRLLVGKATEGDQALVHGAISTIRDLHGEAGFKATPNIPAGYRLVPEEPTDRMTYIGQTLRYESVYSIGEIYRQMIAASPSAGGV